MKPSPESQRRRLLHAGLAAGAALWLPSRARACEYFSPTLRVLHPWTRASPHGATTAMVSMKFDEVTEGDRLIAVSTPVAAAAEMGGQSAAPAVDFAVPAGRESELSEHGTYLRLVGLKLPLEVGRSYPLKLTFEVGGIVAATLSVDYAGFRFL